MFRTDGRPLAVGSDAFSQVLFTAVGQKLKITVRCKQADCRALIVEHEIGLGDPFDRDKASAQAEQFGETDNAAVLKHWREKHANC